MGSKKSRGRAASAGLRKRLEQIRACEASGETLKAYAARHSISVQALYQAKKQARQQGIWPVHGTQKTQPARSEPKKRVKAMRRPRPRFVEAISVPAAAPAGCAWRLQLRSGDVLESNTPLSDHETLALIGALRERS